MTFRRLLGRIILWQLGFTAVALALAALLPVKLLLLPLLTAPAASARLAVGLLIGGVLAAGLAALLVARRAALLKKVLQRDHDLDRAEIPKLNDDPWRVVNNWAYAHVFSIVLVLLVAPPEGLSFRSMSMVALFSATFVATLSLPLLVAVRREFVEVLGLVPPEIMSEVIDAQVRAGRLRGRTSRRLLAAIANPVAFLAIGSALITASHLVSFRAMTNYTTRVALGESSLNKDDPSLLSLGEVGFPLDPRAIALAAVGLLVAVYVGRDLGARLSRDLRTANRGVRTLGTDAALEGTRVMRPARFHAVNELGNAIELLSDRFRTFAQAQERAIELREAATKARGRFFASVSHDLKSPLNAIVGFAELTMRDEATNQAQRDSLELILQGGNELLALIETILDAARVEAGQLILEYSEESVSDMLELALEKARQLSSHARAEVHLELAPDLPKLVVDKLRFPQALASFIAHARRTAERDQLRILVDVEARDERPSLQRRKLTFFIEVPSARFSARELEALLSPETHPGQHRGMALALRLAKSIIELHGGSVTLTGRTVSEPAFAIQMRARRGQ